MSRLLFASTLVFALTAPLAATAQSARFPGTGSSAAAGKPVTRLGGGVNGGPAKAPEISTSGAVSGLILLVGSALVLRGKKQTA